MFCGLLLEYYKHFLIKVSYIYKRGEKSSPLWMWTEKYWNGEVQDQWQTKYMSVPVGWANPPMLCPPNQPSALSWCHPETGAITLGSRARVGNDFITGVAFPNPSSLLCTSLSWFSYCYSLMSLKDWVYLIWIKPDNQVMLNHEH